MCFVMAVQQRTQVYQKSWAGVKETEPSTERGGRWGSRETDIQRERERHTDRGRETETETEPSTERERGGWVVGGGSR